MFHWRGLSWLNNTPLQAQAVALAVVHRDPVGIELGHPIGAARIERRVSFCDFLHQAVELTRAGLVDPRFVR